MKTAVAIILSLSFILSVTAVLIPDTCDSSDCTPAPTFIEENDTGRLYRLDLDNGPLYFYEIDTENGTITKIIAIATINLTLTPCIG